MFAADLAVAMKQSEQKRRCRLTDPDTIHKVCIPGEATSLFSAEPEDPPGTGFNAIGIHSRHVYALPALRNAGVCHGLESDRDPEPRQPTRQWAWWAFCF